MDISDADMIMAADRGERLYRARRAQALLRGARAARAPMSRFAPRLMRAPVYRSRFGRSLARQTGSMAPEVNSLDTIVAPVAGTFVMTSAVAGAEPTAFTGLTEINLVRQGATFYNRIGNKVHMRSVSVFFTPCVATSNGVINLRWMLVYDKQPNGAFPALTDVLATNDAGTVEFHSSLNMTNRSRFMILRDKLETFSTVERSSAICKDFVRLNLDTEFKSNAGTIGDISTGALFLLAFVDWYDGSNKLATSPQSAFGGITCRLRFDP